MQGFIKIIGTKNTKGARRMYNCIIKGCACEYAEYNGLCGSYDCVKDNKEEIYEIEEMNYDE